MDATAVQRIKAGLTISADDLEKAKIRGTITGEKLDIMDATAIQRFKAGYDNIYGIGQLKLY
jgi:hypothetical protein